MIAQESSTPDNAQRAGIRPWMTVAAALLAGNLLLLVAPPGPVRTAGALLTLVLPGLALAEVLLSNTSRLLRWTVGAGLGYAFIIGAGLALIFLPGPLSRWGVLLLADGLSLLLIVILLRSGKRAVSHGDGSRLIPLVMILLVAGFFRFASLGYSEFQGDEVKAMMPAARVLEGDPNALMLERKKGPAEALLPLLPWRLAVTTDETSARLPRAGGSGHTGCRFPARSQAGRQSGRVRGRGRGRAERSVDCLLANRAVPGRRALDQRCWQCCVRGNGTSAGGRVGPSWPEYSPGSACSLTTMPSRSCQCWPTSRSSPSHEATPWAGDERGGAMRCWAHCAWRWL